ncbi:hypothetical protein LF1_46950 [Rubripirellula obstinata]|uniref:Protein nucleotidyltransferase YdiU n=1 Tax=Rubripirellula obstinata TaxID=406547 RepID=A0A5B1CSE6_9BACT|nr:YdiU family protein [Rubripirellula obstinata]KAA1262134.1 hypothetical protein LF1_46950 [Rubripirellula obstinata]
MQLNLDDRFNTELPADVLNDNARRQVHDAAFSFVTPRVPSNPQVVHVADEVAALIGLSSEDVQSDDFVQVFSGGKVPQGARPYAMCYGGHQFGNWAGQLGDGRAINLAEVQHQGRRWTLQLKGAGETPYSRTADGLAVLRSSVREHLCSEAMFHLGVATTRSLSLITTGDQVMRDMMYDGNPQYEPGAVVCRVAPAFIRFGNFEIFASRDDQDNLRKLADYTIKHYFPEIQIDANSESDHYVEFFRQVSQRTLAMIVDWQRVGFVHGVMNTDNMSILGETIDYGPYGWLEGFDHDWTPNTTDSQNGRYRYGYQPRIAAWNLAQLANALFPLIGEAEPLQQIIDEFLSTFVIKHDEMMAKKLGFGRFQTGDAELIRDLEEVLQLTETDMTIFFRNLAKVQSSTDASDSPGMTAVMDAFYAPDELNGETLSRWQSWFSGYIQRIASSGTSDEERAEQMNAVNPKYVLRNYMAQLAIDKATAGDFSLVSELHDLLRQPYDEQPASEKWFAKRPDWARNKVGCSMLSCSS